MSTKNPEFIIYCGPMFSAKTTSLLLVLEKYKHQKKKIAVFKPLIDDRYSYDRITSHGGSSTYSNVVTVASDLLKVLSEMDSEPDVVAVDEAFMIPGISEVLIYLYRLGMTVIVSSLDVSANGKPFLEVEKMFPWATQVHKLSAACTICGADAHYTHKKTSSSEEIEVGGSDIYEPRCFNHHLIINKNPQTKP